MLKKLLCGALLVCSLNSTVTAATTLNRSLPAEPASLFPSGATDVASNRVLGDLFEGLVIADQNGKIIPGVAERWELDASGKIYTFHLRNNAKWSNGEKVTAKDFVYAWRHIINPKTAAPYAFIMYTLENAEAINKMKEKDITKLGVKALDELTLQVTLHDPTPYFMASLLSYAFHPIHQASLEKHGNKVTRPGNLVSNGAYTLADWRPQTLISLKKNTFYWDREHTKIDKVNYFPIEDANAKIKKYRAGEIDMTYQVTAERIPFIKKDPKISKDLKSSPYLGTYYYGINMGQAPLGESRKVREALSLAIDRDKIVREVSKGGERPAYSFVPPETANNKPSYLSFKDMTQKERIERAQKLYKEAGYSKAKPLEIEITYNTAENHKKIAIACAGMWNKALGVKVKLLNKEWKVFLAERKNAQMFRGGWVGDYNDPNSFLDMMKSDGSLNHVSFNNKKYDALIEEGSRTTDLEKRAEIFAKAEKIFLSEHAIIPIYYCVTTRLVSPVVKGYYAEGNNLLDIRYSKDLEVNR